MAINDYNNLIENQVIKYLRQKTSNGFEDITWLGAEQRFVSPIRHSNLDNLEEQFIIGTDTYTITEEDLVGNEIEEKYFCPLENAGDITNAENYYLMYSITYKNGSGQHYSFDDETHALVLSNYMNDSQFDGDTVVFKNSQNYSTFIFDEEDLVIAPQTIETKQQVLYYINGENKSDVTKRIPILTKITAIMNAESGGEGHPTRRVVREKIINHRLENQNQNNNIVNPDSGI